MSEKTNVQKNSSQKKFAIILGSFFLFCVLGIASIGAEVFLKLQAQKHALEKTPLHEHDYHKNYRKFYEPFTIQYLNPYFYFSPPWKKEDIKKSNNEVVSVDERGFRGDGPEEKGNRKLAFFIGGSAAFGQGSTKNSTTVSGYLNQVQSEYFFVNAGAPSWNSLQEFYRISIDLLRYKPSLILVYDGFNDAVQSYYYGDDYPPGVVDSYLYFAQKYDDIRAMPEEVAFAFRPNLILRKLFPNLSRFLRREKRVNSESSKPVIVPKEDFSLPNEKRLVDGAEFYLRQISLMSKIASAHGVKLKVVWQPSVYQSQKISPENLGYTYAQPKLFGYIDRYYRYVKSHQPKELDFIDLHDVFDRHFESVPVGDTFVDVVHTYDKGNAIIAEDLAKLLK